MAERKHIPCIYVLAGTNGAGKSSLGGAMFLETGAEYFNPDEAALRFRAVDPGMTQEESEKIEVRIWYVGLASPELHIARVRSRVAAGGHDIPEAKIRERYENSRLNLVDLMPKLTELRVFDNSEEGDPRRGIAPRPRLLLHMDRGKIVDSCDLTKAPQWAKPILMTAIKLSHKD